MQLTELHQQLLQQDPKADAYAEGIVAGLLQGALALRASDVHLQPTTSGYHIKIRIDGVLQTLGDIPRGEKTDAAARLKILAGLLTYRTDIPQEGRVSDLTFGQEVRVSTFPALHGERVVIRILWQQDELHHISDLGLPKSIADDLAALLKESSGMILVAGPAGSGKSTTAYACLRHIATEQQGGRSIVTLEDPIESEIPGISQSHIRPSAGFDFATGLRSLMRQDPEVILVGEIRDPVTVETAMQASLTGQLVLSTFHSGSAAEAIRRLIDMGIPTYMIQSGLLGVLHQRLVRTLCECAIPCEEDQRFGFAIAGMKQPGGCEKCRGIGYLGRTLLAEWLVPHQHRLSQLSLETATSASIEAWAVEAGMLTRWSQAEAMLSSGITSPAEIRRVLGFRDDPSKL
ncbi:secretion protein [Blastopirellula marina]|uniref:Secretion protein n=1 Tax=Blastopirellula marina TaxID=124 RepID=A0A2S8FXI5_9BACT|nr:MULTISPECIES: GspE/PulE family protein [Pirellulaceae]PQO36892.1 secretion protein [Blastopirellula marina]RCS53607.1 type II/IV secretion system protein [Bremerella cremea]